MSSDYGGAEIQGRIFMRLLSNVPILVSIPVKFYRTSLTETLHSNTPELSCYGSFIDAIETT